MPHGFMRFVNRYSFQKSLVGFFLVACLLSVAMAPGCTQLGLTDPAKLEGVQPGEANKLRVIQAALIVQGSYVTIDQQLTRGVITPAEARKAKDATDQAAKAVDVAAQAVKLENASAPALLDALDVLLLQILRDRAKAGA